MPLRLRSIDHLIEVAPLTLPAKCPARFMHALPRASVMIPPRQCRQCRAQRTAVSQNRRYGVCSANNGISSAFLYLHVAVRLKTVRTHARSFIQKRFAQPRRPYSGATSQRFSCVYRISMRWVSTFNSVRHIPHAKTRVVNVCPHTCSAACAG